jgi:hypothetical protein
LPYLPPTNSQWDPDVKGLCGNQIASFAAIEISGMVLDVVILALPVLALRPIQPSLPKKLWLLLLIDAGVMYVDTDYVLLLIVTDIFSEYLSSPAFVYKHFDLQHLQTSRTLKAI